MIALAQLAVGARVRRRRRFVDDLIGTVLRIEDDRIIVHWDGDDKFLNYVIDSEEGIIVFLELIEEGEPNENAKSYHHHRRVDAGG